MLKNATYTLIQVCLGHTHTLQLLYKVKVIDGIDLQVLVPECSVAVLFE